MDYEFEMRVLKSKNKIQYYETIKEKYNSKNTQTLIESINHCKTLENHLLFMRDLEISKVNNNRRSSDDLPTKSLDILYDLGIYLYYKQFNILLYDYDPAELLFDDQTILFGPEDFYRTALLIMQIIDKCFENIIKYEKFVKLISFSNLLQETAMDLGYLPGLVAEMKKLFAAIFEDRYSFITSDIEEKKLLLYKRAIKAKGYSSAVADFYLGICNEYGIGETKDINKAIRFYKKYIKSKNNEVMLVYKHLAFAYIKNHEYRKAVDTLELGVKKNDPASIYYLAELKRDGIVALLDLEGSDALFRKLSSIDHEEASLYYERSLKYLNNPDDQYYYDESFSTIENLDLSCFKYLANPSIEKDDSTSDYNLNKSQFLSVLVDHNNQQSNHEKNQLLRTFFENNVNKMQPATKDMIVNSLILFDACNKDLKLIDYSPIVLGLLKAVEIELGHHFYYEYIKYLKTNFHDLDYYIISADCFYSNKFIQSTLKTKNDFTLGRLKYIIFLNPNKSFIDFEDNAFSQYIKNEYCSSKTAYMDSRKWYQFFVDLDKKVSTIKDYRNRHLHTDGMDFTTAKQCYDYILKSSRIINLVLQYK